jgi:non-lysosomal glucosylceramidase
MPDDSSRSVGRRDFLKRSIAAAAVAPAAGRVEAAGTQAPAQGTPGRAAESSTSPAAPRVRVTYPRVFAGDHLSQIAFPLGGIGAGTIGLGGRGQLRDWEIYNRPDRGNAPGYAFPSIRVERGRRPPLVSVLEARIAEPYQGPWGLGSRSAPGLQRLEGATFTGEFPLARVDFHDSRMPVEVRLDAFSPFIPHDPDDSGLPVAILRYTVTNPQAVPTRVSIAYSVENPLLIHPLPRYLPDPRRNQVRHDDGLDGVLMSNPEIFEDHPLFGTIGLWAMRDPATAVSVLSGWPRARWWTSALHFWDDFSADGTLGPESAEPGPVAAVCLDRTIAARSSGAFTFLITWRFPNRTPDRCGWDSSPGEGGTPIGNHYCTRFEDATAAARHVAANLDRLEARTRRFAQALRESTVPAAVKDAASANLSTLVSQTCFRTADGEFHGFEGCGDQSGCCEGNCTHVWNYETATAHLFPQFSVSLRRAAFGYSMDDGGGMRFRQRLPDGAERFPTAAADGQMGQIMKVYLDWQLSGDRALLDELWPRVKKAIAFAWLEHGWDADRDGVLEGAQHNTYDIEFYGPNPLCGIYYLGALRAVEEMAAVVGDATMRDEARRLFVSGRDWIDANLFNGEYYVQQVRGLPRDAIRPELLNTMGSDRTDVPEYQMGDGCLIDQLIGQYQAEISGLGPLVDPAKCRAALQSVYRYNYKRHLYDHDNVMRTFALNDEAALVIADYGKGERPAVPFPYYAEVFTGIEHATASHMIYAGMVREGIECIGNVRARYDGARRNPWDEAECGSHYARAMASWSGLLALSGFLYHGAEGEVRAQPRLPASGFRCFWSTGTGWGSFAFGKAGTPFRLAVLSGALPCRSLVLAWPAGLTPSTVRVDQGRALAFHASRREGALVIALAEPERLAEGQEIVVE